VAIAGEADTFEHAMLEAAALLSDGARAVLAVIAEERPPSAYDEWIDDVPFSYAVALRIGAIDANEDQPAGTTWELHLEADQGTSTAAAWPHALDLVRAWHAGDDTLIHAWKTRRWIWRRLG
jgi:hypothetical protein